MKEISEEGKREVEELDNEMTYKEMMYIYWNIRKREIEN